MPSLRGAFDPRAFDIQPRNVVFAYESSYLVVTGAIGLRNAGMVVLESGAQRQGGIAFLTLGRTSWSRRLRAGAPWLSWDLTQNVLDLGCSWLLLHHGLQLFIRPCRVQVSLQCFLVAQSLDLMYLVQVGLEISKITEIFFL